MKNRLLILTLIGLIVAVVPANAELTTGDIASPAYLKNHGHSKPMIEATQINKSRSHGEEYADPDADTFYEKTPIKYIRHLFMYIDPLYDDDWFMKHDIKSSPTYRDL